jgi:two-component system, LuxR family, response regulator FixJ
MLSHSPQVAVVDDDPKVRMSLQRLLEPEGFEVMTFCSGQALLDTLEGKLPDCLVMDIHMPGPNGFETIALLRENGLDPKVVFITGDDAEELARQNPDYKSKLLSKPFLSSVLLHALRDALSTQPSPKPAP